MPIKDWKKEILTIPNLLSLFRLVLIPVYMVIYLNARDPGDHFVAAAILAVSCLTDLIDGKIARHFNMITTVGKVLDPLADKATQFSLIICLAIKYPKLWNVVWLFVAKELFQLIAGSIRLKKGKILKGALITGKVCTTVLFISLIAMVCFPVLPDNVVDFIITVDTIFLCISFGDYAFTYFRRDSMFQSISDPANRPSTNTQAER